MVLAYHLIWTAYGWWLANDPRGSGSRNIRVAKLAELGPVHFGRKAVQPRYSVVREFQAEAAPLLKYPPRVFTSDEIQIIAEAFRTVIRENRYACHACAIMPEHVHLVMGRRLTMGEAMAKQFQDESRAALIEAGCFSPMHAVWTNGQRVIFKDTPKAVLTCIRYAENNPLEIGWPKQVWDFVTVYDPSFRPF